MRFKKWIVVLSICASSAAFALNQQEILKLINQPNHTAALNSHRVNNQAELNWVNLHGPQSGGYVHIVVLKNNPAVLFAFNPHGSVYKSMDSGNTWKSTFVSKNEWITDLVEVDQNRLLMTADNHVYSSDDQGEHWTRVATKDTICSNLYVANPNLIFMITNKMYDRPGFYRSVDGGLSWEPSRLGIDDSQWFWTMGIKDNVLLVSANGLFISTDNGKLWKQPSKEWSERTFDSIAVSSKNDIFVSNSRVYLTDVEGKTWNNIYKGLAGRVEQIAIDKKDRLYAITSDYEKKEDVLNTTIDKGQTWQRLYVYPGIHDMTVLDNDHVMLSTSEGVFEIDDHQQNLKRLSLNFSVANTSQVLATSDQHFYAIDKSYRSDVDSKLYRSDDAGATWSESRTGHIVDITEFNNKVIELEWDKNGNDQHFMASEDNGITWKNIYDNIYKTNHSSCNSLSFQNGALIAACDKHAWFTKDLSNWKTLESGNGAYYYDGKSIYTSNGKVIKRSIDEGSTWSVLLDNLHGYDVKMSGYADTVLIAVYDAGIIKITNNGNDWDLINYGISDYHFSGLKAIDADHYIVSTNDGIFYTRNGGKHWTAENMGLDNLDVSSIYANKKFILAGTKGSGVYFASRNQ